MGVACRGAALKQYYSTTEWSFGVGGSKEVVTIITSQILDDIAPDGHIRARSRRMEAIFGMVVFRGCGGGGFVMRIVTAAVLSRTVVEGTIWAPLVLQEFVKDGQNLNGVHVVDVLVGYTAARCFGLHHMVSMVLVVRAMGLRVMMTASKAQGVGLI